VLWSCGGGGMRRFLLTHVGDELLIKFAEIDIFSSALD
jgi:hypothetical protein